MISDFDISKILECLPHRYPFLMVDRVLELVKDEKIVALKNVSINEQFFQGHFPSMPIMPGVLIIEAMGQAGGILLAANLPAEKQGNLFYFMGFDKVRFRKPVRPGDQLVLELTLLKKRSKVVKMAGTAFVDDIIVAEAELMATFGEKK
jgi:beta-hydroxyacyl-ACP dehydratase FabZ